MKFITITVINSSSSIFTKGDVVYVNPAHIQWVKVLGGPVFEVCFSGTIVETDSPVPVL